MASQLEGARICRYSSPRTRGSSEFAGLGRELSTRGERRVEDVSHLDNQHPDDERLRRKLARARAAVWNEGGRGDASR